MLDRSSSFSSSLSLLIDRCNSARHLQQILSKILTSPLLLRSSILLTRLLFSFSLSSSSSSSSSSHHLPLSLFRLIPCPSLFAYNAIIRSLSTSSSPLPISLYSQLLLSPYRPDHLTFPFLIKNCSRRRDPAAGQYLHSHVLKLGLHADTFIQNSLISMYSACGRLPLARQTFDEMPHQDVVSENSLLVGYLRCGELNTALALFLCMKGRRNVRTWNSIITGLVQGGRCLQALDLFHEMLLPRADGELIRPDKITVAGVISTCASLGALDQGKWVHAYLKRREDLEFDVVIGTALIDMYGKCGCVERALEVFEEMPERDVLAWTAMISALAVNGLGESAFLLFEEMEKHGANPNLVTFGALLSACAHSGMVERGQWCFDAMKGIYSLDPQPHHYACMVDLLGRAGLFEEAERLIECMPMEPDSFVWGALLGACRMHGNVELGERVAGHLIGLDPVNHAYYIVLSDIYANANRFEEVKKIRACMKDQGIKKTAPGCSMIEVDGQVHEFSVKSTQEDLLKEIEWVLTDINDELKRTGYMPDDIVELSQLT